MFDVDLPAGLVPADTKARTAAGVCFLEGPAWHASGDLYFSDIAGNRILKLAPDGNINVFRADSGRTNGNTFDAQGRLISCEGAEFGPGAVNEAVLVRNDGSTQKLLKATGVALAAGDRLTFRTAGGGWGIPVARTSGCVATVHHDAGASRTTASCASDGARSPGYRRSRAPHAQYSG